MFASTKDTMIDDEQAERALFVTFHRFEEFSSLQLALLKSCSAQDVDPSAEDPRLLLNKLLGIVGAQQ